VGGAVAVETLRRAGFHEVHAVGAQFAPDPDFPTVAFPNPEEPGATDALLALAADVEADVAIALDPDADRCAVGIPTGKSGSGWRMLSGDETGWLLGDYLLSRTGNPETAVVASTVVSSRMLAAIAAHYGATHVETLTGFKWLARADSDVPGGTLVYAYEEAIGHCVDPDAVRDKDGISAAVLVCDLVAMLKEQGRCVPDALDDLARRHGVHDVAAVSRRVTGADEAAELMRRLRAAPPSRLAGFAASISGTTDITDPLILTGGDDETSARVVVRPSGTEPKLKCYLEVRCAVTDDLRSARERARTVLGELVLAVRSW
jgi:phosphomannomutase